MDWGKPVLFAEWMKAIRKIYLPDSPPERRLPTESKPTDENKLPTAIAAAPLAPKVKAHG